MTTVFFTQVTSVRQPLFTQGISKAKEAIHRVILKVRQVVIAIFNSIQKLWDHFLWLLGLKLQPTQVYHENVRDLGTAQEQTEVSPTIACSKREINLTANESHPLPSSPDIVIVTSTPLRTQKNRLRERLKATQLSPNPIPDPLTSSKATAPLTRQPSLPSSTIRTPVSLIPASLKKPMATSCQISDPAMTTIVAMTSPNSLLTRPSFSSQLPTTLSALIDLDRNKIPSIISPSLPTPTVTSENTRSATGTLQGVKKQAREAFLSHRGTTRPTLRTASLVEQNLNITAAQISKTLENHPQIERKLRALLQDQILEAMERLYPRVSSQNTTDGTLIHKDFAQATAHFSILEETFTWKALCFILSGFPPHELVTVIDRTAHLAGTTLGLNIAALIAPSTSSKASLEDLQFLQTSTNTQQLVSKSSLSVSSRGNPLQAQPIRSFSSTKRFQVVALSPAASFEAPKSPIIQRKASPHQKMDPSISRTDPKESFQQTTSLEGQPFSSSEPSLFISPATVLLSLFSRSLQNIHTSNHPNVTETLNVCSSVAPLPRRFFTPLYKTPSEKLTPKEQEILLAYARLTSALSSPLLTSLLARTDAFLFCLHPLFHLYSLLKTHAGNGNSFHPVFFSLLNKKRAHILPLHEAAAELSTLPKHLNGSAAAFIMNETAAPSPFSDDKRDDEEPLTYPLSYSLTTLAQNTNQTYRDSPTSYGSPPFPFSWYEQSKPVDGIPASFIYKSIRSFRYPLLPPLYQASAADPIPDRDAYNSTNFILDILRRRPLCKETETLLPKIWLPRTDDSKTRMAFMAIFGMGIITYSSSVTREAEKSPASAPPSFSTQDKTHQFALASATPFYSSDTQLSKKHRSFYQWIFNS